MARKDVIIVLSFDDKGTAKVKQVTKVVKKELDKTGKSAQKMGKDFNAMEKQVRGSEKGMGRMRKMMKSTWAQMAMGMGVMMGVSGAIRMLVRTVSGVIKAGTEFEETWANVTTMLSGPAYEAAEDMKEELLRMSPVLGGVTELAKGMYQVLSASIEPAKAIEFLGTAAISAKAGVTDVFTAVDALTTIINAYGLATEDAMKVSDIMFMAVKRGKLTYEGLARSLGPVVAISAQLGIGFEEVAAAMATLTRQGIEVRTAGVAIRQVLVGVMNQQKEAVDTAKRLEIGFTAQALKAKGLIGFLADLAEKTKGNIVPQQKMFGNIRALMAVLPLAGKAMKEVADDLVRMKNATGSTTEAFKKQMDSLAFWIRTFKDMFDRLRVAIWMGLSKPLKEGIKDSEDFQKRVEETSEKMVDFGEAFGESIGKSIRTLIELRDTLALVTKVAVAFFAIKKILAWRAAFALSMAAASASATAFGGVMSAVGTVVTVALLPALAVLATALAALAFGRWISNVTGWTKAMYKGAGAMTGWGEASADSMYWQQKLRDAIKGTDMTVVQLRIEYGNYKAALDAVVASENPAIAKSLELAEAERAHAAAVKTLADQVDELKLKIRQDVVVAFRDLAAVLGNAAVEEMFTEKQLASLAKQLIELGEELDYEVSPRIRAFAGDFTFLMEKVEKTIPPMRELRGVTEEELAPSFMSASVAGTSFWMSLRSTFEWMEKLANVTKTTGIVLRTTAEGELKAKLEVYETLKKERGRFTDVELKGEKALVSRIIALRLVLGGVISEDLKKRAKELGVWADDTTDTWGKVADDISRYWQTGIAEMIAGTATFGDLVRNTFSTLAAGVGSAVGEMAKGALSSIGAMAGPIGSILGGIAASAISLLGKLFGGKTKAEKEAEAAKKKEEEMKRRVIGLQMEFWKFGKISDDLAKQILDLRKQYGQLTGDLMALSDVMAETGIDMKNIEDYSQEMIKNLELIHRGTIDAATGTKELGEAWSEFIEGVIDLGQEGSKYVIEFIQRVRELNIEIEELNEYVFDWLEKGVSGMMAMVEAAGENEEALQRMGSLALTTFNALIEQGMSWTEALEMMAEPLEALRTKFEELGISGGAAFEQLMKVVKVREENEALFAAIDANNQLLQALGNTGYLTADALADVAANAMGYYDQLIGAGLTAGEALAVMAPQLQQLAYYAEQYGLELGQATQELVDQAKEAGLISEAAESELHNEIDRVVDGLEAIEDALKGGGRGAQHGFHGEVTGPETFHIEPGVQERVDITPIGETGGAREVNVVVNPVVLPLPDFEGYLIKFLPQATEDEIITIHPNAVRKGT